MFVITPASKAGIYIIQEIRSFVHLYLQSFTPLKPVIGNFFDGFFSKESLFATAGLLWFLTNDFFSTVICTLNQGRAMTS